MQNFTKSAINFFTNPLKISHFYSKLILSLSLFQIVVLSLETINIRLKEFNWTHNWKTGMEFIIGYDSLEYSPSGYQSIFFLVMIFLAQIIFILSWLVFMSKRYQIPNYLDVIWRLGILINFYVLSFPLFNAMLSLIIKITNLSTDVSYIHIGLAITNIVLNLVILIPGYITIPLKSDDSFGRWNNQFDLLTHAHKYTLSLITLLIRNSSNFSINSIWIICLSNLAFSFIECLKLIISLPYFSSCMNLTSIYLQSYIFTISLSTCLFLDAGIDQKFLIETCIIFTFFVAPVCAKLIFSLSTHREGKEWISCVNNYDMKNAIISPKILMKMFKSASKKILINDDKKFMVKDEFNTYTNLIKFKQLSSHLDSSDSEQNLNGYLKLYLDQRFIHSAKLQEKLILAFLYVKYQDEIYKPLSICLSVIKSLKAGRKSKLAAYWVLKQIESKIGSKLNENLKETTLHTYFQNMRVYDSLMNKIDLHLSEYKKFYINLSDPCPSLLDIYFKSKRIQEINKTIENSWDQISEESKLMSSKILRNFALYKIILKTDADKGISMLKKYNNTMVKRAILSKNLPEISKRIFDPHSFTVEVSIEKEKFGDIIKADFSTMTAQLGFMKSDLLGRNLSKIYPLSLRDQVVSLLSDSLKASSDPGKVQSSICFLNHAEGYVSLYSYVFMIHPLIENGLRYLFLYTPIKSKDEYLLVSNSGALESATHRAYRVLKKKKFDLKTDFYKEFGYELNQVSERDEFAAIYMSRHQNASKSTEEFKMRKQSIESPSKLKDKGLKIYQISKLEKTKSSHKEKEKKEEDFGKSVLEVIPSARTVSKEDIEAEKSNTTITEIFEENDTQEFESEHLDDKFDNLEVQSVRSANSEHITLAKMKNQFYLLLNKQDLYKFWDRFLLLGSISLALILMAIALLFCYNNATNSMIEVQKGVSFVRALYARTSTIADITRSTYQDFSSKLYQTSFNTVVLNRIAAVKSNGPGRVKLVASAQQTTRMTLNTIDDPDLQKKFYEKNIRVYYDDYFTINTSTKYMMMNNFEAIDSLITNGYNFLKIIDTNSTELINTGYYLITLSMNDLWIVNKQLPNYALESIYTILDNINLTTNAIYSACVAGLVFYFITMIYVFVRYYNEALRFLSAFSQGDLNFNLEICQSINDFEKKISGQIKVKEISNRIFDKEKAKEKKTVIKSFRNRGLFLSFFAFKITSMTLIIIPSSVLLYSSYKYPSETSSIVSSALQDMKNLNEIAQGATELVTDSNLYDYVPYAFTKNVKPSDIYQAEIEELDNLVSLQKGFSSKGLEYLSRNLCPYYIKGTFNLTCLQTINGQAQYGIKNVIIALKQLHKNLKAYSESFTNLYMRARMLVATTEKQQALSAAMNILVPGVRVFCDEITTDLVNDLQERVDKIITIFGVSLFVNVMVILLVLVWIGRALKKERWILANTMIVVPLEFVTRNKMLRMYLIKKSRDFFGLCKDLDKKLKYSF